MELNQFPWRWEGDIQKSQNFDLSRLLLSHRLDFEVWYNIISPSCTKGHSAPSSRTALKYKYGAGFTAGGDLANDPKMTKKDKKTHPAPPFWWKNAFSFLKTFKTTLTHHLTPSKRIFINKWPDGGDISSKIGQKAWSEVDFNLHRLYFSTFWTFFTSYA